MTPRKNLPARLGNSRPFRYVFIGGVSYFVELVVLVSLANILLLSPEISVAWSFWIGLFVSFLLQKYVTFANKKNDRRSIGRQTALYGTLVFFNYFFTIIFVSVFTNLLGLIIARTVALVLTVSWNYFVYKRIFEH